MELNIPCATWVKEEDEKVLNLLRSSDRWLTVEELSEKTGLPPRRVETTLRLLQQQMAHAESRRKLFSEE